MPKQQFHLHSLLINMEDKCNKFLPVFSTSMKNFLQERDL